MKLSQWHTRGMLCALLAFVQPALAADPVTNTLTVQRIVQNGGVETAAPATQARPGDLLEYVAEFHNNGGSTARGLSATLPLPAGTEFVSASQHPADASASTDGVSFAAIPLKRTVRQADGSLREEPVPYAEYRYLRWPATELAAGAAFKVSARVAVASSEPTRVAAK